MGDLVVLGCAWAVLPGVEMGGELPFAAPANLMGSYLGN
jgi:hypothetical protein